MVAVSIISHSDPFHYPPSLLAIPGANQKGRYSSRQVHGQLSAPFGRHRAPPPSDVRVAGPFPPGARTLDGQSTHAENLSKDLFGMQTRGQIELSRRQPVETDQIKGILIGLAGTADYERQLGPQVALDYAQNNLVLQGFGQLLLVMILILSGITFFVRGRK